MNSAPEHSQNISGLTETVIGCAFKVHNTLGFGFLESIYEKSLQIELRKLTLDAQAQAPIHVYYQGEQVGNFYADLLIDNRLIVELKSLNRLTKTHEVQLVNYLTATGIEDGLLINFGPEGVEMKRKYRTHRKP